MKAKYYDPNLYIASDSMPFTIRLEYNFKNEVDGEALRYAIDKTIPRYPYFSIHVVRDGEEYLIEPNEKPVVIFNSDTIPPLGSKETNEHLIALGYHGKQINIYLSHAITDGGGSFNFVKTLIYYYICKRENVELDPTGIVLADTPFFDGELGNPFLEEKMKNAAHIYRRKVGKMFTLKDGGYVNNSKATVYRFRMLEKEVMRFSFDHDGSPCALMSVMMAKTIWMIHPDIQDKLVCAVSFNARPALGNRCNWHLLSGALLLEYPAKLKSEPILKLCTCSRGNMTIWSQPENVLYHYEICRNEFEAMENLTLEEKKGYMSAKAIVDSHANTYSISYVGRPNFGAIEPYLDTVYNVTDGSTHDRIFLEISSTNGYFDVAVIQGFEGDIYYKELMRQLRSCGINCIEDEKTLIRTPGIVLP